MTARRAPQSRRAHERGRGAEKGDPEAVPVDEPAESVADDTAREAPAEEAGGKEPLVSEDVHALKDKWLRAEAELQNFRRRASRDREEARRGAEEAVVLDVISVMDDLDRALDAARKEKADSAWVEGFEMVAARLRDMLSRRGVEQIDPVGEPFDPEFHEALLEIDASEGARPGDVVQVVLKGYRREGRALRAARVVVAREPDREA